MSWRGLLKWRMSPTSTTNVTAATRSTPRSACSASTSGARLQVGRNSPLARSRRASRSSASRTPSMSSSAAPPARPGARSSASPASCGSGGHPSSSSARGRGGWRRKEECPTWRFLRPTSLHRGRPCPHQVAHRLVGGVRDPDRGQLAGAQEPGQAERVRRRLVLTRSPGFFLGSATAPTPPRVQRRRPREETSPARAATLGLGLRAEVQPLALARRGLAAKRRMLSGDASTSP